MANDIVPASASHRRHRSDETSRIVMATEPAVFLNVDETPPELPPRNPTGTGFRKTRSGGTVTIGNVAVPPSGAAPPVGDTEPNYFIPADTLRPMGGGRSNNSLVVSLQEMKNRSMHERILSQNPRNTQPRHSEGSAVSDTSEYSDPFDMVKDGAREQRARGSSVHGMAGSPLDHTPAPPRIVRNYLNKTVHSDTALFSRLHDPKAATDPPDFAPPPPPSEDGPLFSPPLPGKNTPPSTDYEDPWDSRPNLRNLPIHRRVGLNERRNTEPAAHRRPPIVSPQSEDASQPKRGSRSHHRLDLHMPPSDGMDPHHRSRTNTGGTMDYIPPDSSPINHSRSTTSGEPEYVVPPDAMEPMIGSPQPPQSLHERALVNGGQHYVNQPPLPALPPRNPKTHGYPPLVPDPSITPTDVHRAPPPQWYIDSSVPLEGQL